MQARYKGRVEFLAVYISEAHPTDGWRMETNDRVGIKFRQPLTNAERGAVAMECCSAMKIKMPMVVDDINDRVGHLYSGMPDRLYVIDRRGRVTYKSGRGPRGFKPAEMEQSLILLLMDQAAP